MIKKTWFYIESPMHIIAPFVSANLYEVMSALREGMTVTKVPDRMPFVVIGKGVSGTWR